MEPITFNQTNYYLDTDPQGTRVMCIAGDQTGFHGTEIDGVLHCPLDAANAAALRAALPWLNPQPLGLAVSFGFGDRLGLATGGHLKAVRGTGIAPIFAQQSVRENQRTGRTPQIVLDDAMWTVFEHDWRQPWGADADHVKEIEDLPLFLAAGYSFYTIDPNQYVDNQAQMDEIGTLRDKVDRLPWAALQTSLAEMQHRYLAAPIDLGGAAIRFTEEDLLRALAKYGHAVAHIKSISDHLTAHLEDFDLETSVDETDTPTSVQEHYYLASELRRLGVPIVSLAPRFIGSFEKGVDYIGDIGAFERELALHAGVMHAIGGYKFSIHTGSDKFSIYPVIARHARNLVHVKTAGTSYLEALRVVAEVDPAFFWEILTLARSRYTQDRATYHVSGQLEKVPPSEKLADEHLIDLFDQFDARQVLHVTFGSVLDEYGDRLMAVLRANPDKYETFLVRHFRRHLEAFRLQ